MCHCRIDSHVVHNNCILIYIYIHLLYKHLSYNIGFVVGEPKINQFLSHVKILLHISLIKKSQYKLSITYCK